VPEFRILLMGPVAVGKSSFINTISSVMSGRIRQLAITGTSTRGITSKVGVVEAKKKYKLRS